MITKRTKLQLMIFVIITLVGVSYVGARYAQLDRLVLDDSYRVTAHFADSGGIFKGAEVTYRGVTIGRVGGLELTEGGVDVHLDIENDSDDIPSETRALVGNRTVVPGVNAIVTWLGQVSSPWSKSRVNAVLGKRGPFRTGKALQ